MRRPTIADVARQAGVSTATVDRVLSGRMKVRKDTARKVEEAAERIGYHGVNLIRHRMRDQLPELRLGLILQKQRHAFYQNLLQEFETQAANLADRRVRLIPHFVESIRPAELSELLLSLRDKVDAVAATGHDHHEVTAAVKTLRDAGIPTFSLLSDFAQGTRESYFGSNNIRVGRTAAWLISKLSKKAGKVGLFIGAHRYHGHELRETGFRSYFRELAPAFELLDTQINLETRDLTYEATHELLRRHDDLVGLYVAGGGMEGAIEAVGEARKPEACTLIVNELTPASRLGLQRGVVSIVIATAIEQIVADVLAQAIDRFDNGMAETPGQRFFTPLLYTPETLP